MKKTYLVYTEKYGRIDERTTERTYTHAVVRIGSNGHIHRPEYCGSKALADKKAATYLRPTVSYGDTFPAFDGQVFVTEIAEIN